MKITWHEPKRLLNLEKHGLDFADAVKVFAAYTASYEDDRNYGGEARYNTVGLLDGRCVTVCHTESGDTIHVISMRKATKNEERILFGG